MSSQRTHNKDFQRAGGQGLLFGLHPGVADGSLGMCQPAKEVSTPLEVDLVPVIIHSAYSVTLQSCSTATEFRLN